MGAHDENIDPLVDAAWGKYEFFQLEGKRKQRRKGYPLLRRKERGCDVEQLIDGKWLLTSRFYRRRTPSPKRWKLLQEGNGKEALQEHVWRFFTASPEAHGEGGRSPEVRGAFRRWLHPPLNGGATRFVGDTEIERARLLYESKLKDLETGDLEALTSQVERGLDRERGRCMLIEQRANFFLTASGLSTSLVLANAGLLLGTNPDLRGLSLQLAAGALLVASICVMAAGLRAIQATTYTFERHQPNGVKTVLDRSGCKEKDLKRRYVAEVITATGREEVIADWKLACLGAARTWFIFGVGGVALLTVLVLIEVLF